MQTSLRGCQCKLRGLTQPYQSKLWAAPQLRPAYRHLHSAKRCTAALLAHKSTMTEQPLPQLLSVAPMYVKGFEPACTCADQNTCALRCLVVGSAGWTGQTFTLGSFAGWSANTPGYGQRWLLTRLSYITKTMTGMNVHHPHSAPFVSGFNRNAYTQIAQ